MSLGLKPKEYSGIYTILILLLLLLWAICGIIGLKVVIGGVYGSAKEAIRQIDTTQRIKAESYPRRPLV